MECACQVTGGTEGPDMGRSLAQSLPRWVPPRRPGPAATHLSTRGFPAQPNLASKGSGRPVKLAFQINSKTFSINLSQMLSV